MAFDLVGGSNKNAQETTSGTGQAQVGSRSAQIVGAGALGVGKGATYVEGGGLSLGKGATLTIFQPPSDNSGLVGALQQLQEQTAAAKTDAAAPDRNVSFNFKNWLPWIALVIGGGIVLWALGRRE